MAEEAAKKRKVCPSLDDLVGDAPPPQRAVVGPRIGPRPPSGPVAAQEAEEEGAEAAARRRAAEAREWEVLRRGREEKQEKSGGREAWMTELPEGSRQDALQFFRGGKTSFSSKGAQGPESAAEWALKPGEKPTLEQEERAAREAAARRLAQEQAEAVQQRVKEFNAQTRPKSLLELHFEEGHEKDDVGKDKKRKKKDKKKKDKKKKDKKKKKKEKKEKKVVTTKVLGAMEVGTWDRDANMKTSLSTEKKVAALTGTGQLAGRFATGL